MIATLVGGTGLTGSFLLRALLADAAIGEVVSVSRRATGVRDAKLREVLVGDLAELPAVADRMRGDLWFCCLGTTMKAAGSRERFVAVDHDAVVAFARIAKAHDARSLNLVSAAGANSGSRIFYNAVKGRTEDDLRALGLRSLTIFRPALLVGPREEFRLGEQVATRTLVPLSRLLPGGVRKRVVTDVRTLAERMLSEGKRAAGGVRVVGAGEI